MNADSTVREYFPGVLTRAESDESFDGFSAKLVNQGWGLWAVEHDGDFLGFTGLSRPSFREGVEIGWRLARHAWGQGFATEAALAALEFGFTELDLAEIISFTAVGNLRSRAVMQRIGMTRDPDDDFDHPNVEQGHPLQRHVLYRLAR